MTTQATGRIRYDRQYRTAASEGYRVSFGDVTVAHLDVHFTHTSVYGSLVVLTDLTEEQILDLIDAIDEAVVLSAEVPRDDFMVTVFRGRQTGLYTDDFLEERRNRRGATPSVAGDDERASRSARRPN